MPSAEAYFPAQRGRRNRQRVLLVPDSFKGTFTAHQVAEALAQGVQHARAQPDCCPLADGGEGTLDVLHTHLGGHLVSAPAHDPLGRPILADYLRADDHTAVVESARSSGLALVTREADATLRASTYGTGELIAAAAHAGARHIILTVGGSATTDGGSGALAAIRARGGLPDARLTVLCDVTVPFEDAALVFGPQKGASPAQVVQLTERLQREASLLSRDPRGVPRTGCAGGLSGALWAEHAAQLVPGADFVMERARFSARARAADLVITGEGAVDTQTLQGKLVHAVSTRARQLARPCAVVAGQINLPDPQNQLGVIAAWPGRTLEQIAAAAHDICQSVLL